MIRVVLPFHLQTLAGTGREVSIPVAAPVTRNAILDALEERYPVLQQDLSHDPADAPLPDAIASGTEPFLIIGAIAGG